MPKPGKVSTSNVSDVISTGPSARRLSVESALKGVITRARESERERERERERDGEREREREKEKERERERPWCTRQVGSFF